MKKIVITGGTGLIGTRLTQMLEGKKYSVFHLSRSKGTEREKRFTWDIGNEMVEEATFEDIDYIIHLAGSNIGEGRWTSSRKKEILESRTNGASLLYRKIRERGVKLKGFISASAIGIYRKNSDELLTETSEPASDFLGSTCQKWEKAVDLFSELNTRVVKVRTGVVLSKNGGALPKMASPVKMLAGAPLGSGKQYMPWIHIDDICQIYIKAIEDESMKGAYNAVSPNLATNREITVLLAKILKRPLMLPPVPEFMLKIIFGEMSTLLLDSQKISADKILKSGYSFKYSDLEMALKNIFQ